MRYILALLAVLGWAGSASGQTFSLDLDVPPGHYSNWSVKDIRGAGEISLQATVVELRNDPKWLPVFSVLLLAGKLYGGLFLSFEGGSQTASGGVRVFAGGDKPSETPLTTNPQFKKPFAVTLRWRADRTMEMAVNGAAVKPVLLPFTPTELRIGASTSEVLVEGIRLK